MAKNATVKPAELIIDAGFLENLSGYENRDTREIVQTMVETELAKRKERIAELELEREKMSKSAIVDVQHHQNMDKLRAEAKSYRAQNRDKTIGVTLHFVSIIAVTAIVAATVSLCIFGTSFSTDYLEYLLAR